MQIPVYGAGPLGSLFAARLHEAGHDATLLARPHRLDALRRHGVVLEDARTGRRSVARLALTGYHAPDHVYDLVLVIMRKNRVAEVLPVLAANCHTPNVLFLMNNAAGPAELVAALGEERDLLGFPMAAGSREGARSATWPGTRSTPSLSRSASLTGASRIAYGRSALPSAACLATPSSCAPI